MLEISHNNIEKKINEKYETIGDLQESVLSKFRLTIYDINYIIWGNHILGSDDLKFNDDVPPSFTNLIILEKKKDDMNKSMIDKIRLRYTQYIQCREDIKIAQSIQRQTYLHQPPHSQYNPYITGRNVDLHNSLSNFVNAILQDQPLVERNRQPHTPHKIVTRMENVDILLTTDTFEKISPTLMHPVTECNICLEEYEDNDVISKMPTCKCVYHYHCIKKWLTCESNKCPICRIKINEGVRKDLIDSENSPEITQPQDELDINTNSENYSQDPMGFMSYLFNGRDSNDNTILFQINTDGTSFGDDIPDLISE
jgi:hypothetical protein